MLPEKTDPVHRGLLSDGFITAKTQVDNHDTPRNLKYFRHQTVPACGTWFEVSIESTVHCAHPGLSTRSAASSTA